MAIVYIVYNDSLLFLGNEKKRTPLINMLLEPVLKIGVTIQNIYRTIKVLEHAGNFLLFAQKNPLTITICMYNNELQHTNYL